MLEDKESAENIINSLIDDLLDASRTASKNGSSDYSEETLAKLDKLKKILPVWSVDLEPCEPEKIDRSANMFGGNPFTSAKHPWLMNAGGNPCYPLVQLDLQKISELCDQELGDGLLQVWLDIADPDLPGVIRVIDPVDMTDALAADYPEIGETQEIDEYGSWFGISHHLSFKFLGYMVSCWGDGEVEWDYERDLSERELEILDKLEGLSEENGYRSLKANWLFGYPDRGSGSPAGRYGSEPRNLIQFATSNAFPMVDVSRYANVFYSHDEDGVTYFFDWNG